MNVRPLYETADTLAAERDDAAIVGRSWRCALSKLPRRYELDYGLTRGGAVVGFAELKRRGHRYGAFSTYMLALSKWKAALELARITALPTMLVVGFVDGIMWVPIAPGFVRVAMGGRVDRGDEEDIEPVVHLPINGFRTLEDGPAL